MTKITNFTNKTKNNRKEEKKRSNNYINRCFLSLSSFVFCLEEIKPMAQYSIEIENENRRDESKDEDEFVVLDSIEFLFEIPIPIVSSRWKQEEFHDWSILSSSSSLHWPTNSLHELQKQQISFCLSLSLLPIQSNPRSSSSGGRRIPTIQSIGRRIAAVHAAEKPCREERKRETCNDHSALVDLTDRRENSRDLIPKLNGSSVECAVRSSRIDITISE